MVMCSELVRLHGAASAAAAAAAADVRVQAVRLCRFVPLSCSGNGCIHNARHMWYTFPEQTKDELLLFVGFDSATPGFTPSVHSSFDLEEAPESAAPRVSADMRLCLIFTGPGADSRPLMRRQKL